MAANTKTNVAASLGIGFVDGIRASVSASELLIFDFPVLCVSRLF